MKLRIITDVVLTPVIRDLKKALPDVAVTDSYEEDIIACLMAYDVSALNPEEILFIHSDQGFHQKPPTWQQTYFSTIAAFAGNIPNKILLSNSISPAFHTPPLSGSVGISPDTFSSFGTLLQDCFRRANVFVFDFERIGSQAGTQNIYQYNLGHLYQMPYTKAFSAVFGSALAEQLQWLDTEEKKAIVIDCDNTLWGGILGENGLDGIHCDRNADGIIYYHFQQFLKAKKEEGFLLCICSKNNENEVKEAFTSKKFPLSWDDFIVRKINWEDKWQNINQVAAELNIGVDSLIFIDDNPFEINSVKELVKGITAFEFKNDYASFLKMTESFSFRRKKILAADIEKSRQYEVEFERKKEQGQFTDIDAFIKSLNIDMDIRLNDISDIERLAQLTGKTNQFNFNKKEYSTGELTNFISEGHLVYSLKVSDRFGDYGTVGLILVEVRDGKAILENFLMSCRALGKRIEDSFYNKVVEEVKQSSGRITDVRFRETLKNKPAYEFYKKIKHEYNDRRAAGDISIRS